jgi:hypothetical protein
MTDHTTDRTTDPPAADAVAFVRAHGEDLAHNLGHHCLVAAQQIVAAMRQSDALPAGVTEPRLMQVLLSMRATIELMAVERRHGEAAHDALLAAMTAYYERTLLAGGRFVTWIRAAHETMRRTPDARRWLTVHALQALGTRELEDARFHTALGYALHVGDAIVDVVEANVTAPGGDG